MTRKRQAAKKNTKVPPKTTSGSRRKTWYLCAVIVLLGGVGLLLTSPIRKNAAELAKRVWLRPPKGKNVMLITLDTTRADRLGCYGHQAAQTPTLDALAAGGVLFEQAFAQVPLTLPSHTSLLTGTYPPSHGIRINSGNALGEELPTLAEAFDARGYRTGAFIGAWVLDSHFGLDRGFDHYDDDIKPLAHARGRPAERRANEVCDAALTWLESDPDVSFFAWIHFFDPHDPYEPISPFKERLADPYDGEIAFVDDQIRRLIDWLDAADKRESTLIVVAGDHGESFDEHEEPEHGLFVYNTTLQVPLILSYPGHVPANRTVTAGVRLVDVNPTILGLMGWAAPAAVQGEDLSTFFRTGMTSFFLPAYGESEYSRRAFGWASLRSLTTERWKYIEAPQPELYDRANDLEELRNVINENAEIAEGLREQLHQMVAEMTAYETETVELTPEAQSNLSALGYVGGSSAAEAAEPSGGRRDPKDMIEIYRAFKLAMHASQALKYRKVVELLEPIVSQSPESETIHGMLGLAYLKLGRHRDAQREFQARVDLAPNGSRNWLHLGDSLMSQNQTASARRCYNKALKIDPDNGEVHNRMGFYYSRQNNLDKAYYHYKRDCELRSRSASPWSNFAKILARLGRPAEALEPLRNAIECDPINASTYQTLGATLSSLGRPREAIAALRRGILAVPRDSVLPRELAWLLATSADAELRDGEEALRLAKMSIEHRREDILNLMVLAAALAETGNFPRAAETARRALSLATTAKQTQQQQLIRAQLRLYESGRPYRQ